MANNFAGLRQIRDCPAGYGIVRLLPALPIWVSAYDGGPDMGWWWERRAPEPRWLTEFTPDLSPTFELGLFAKRALAEFEANHRATLLLLALEGFRLEHGELPESLGQLAGDYFDPVPQDPYCGENFRYFPDGLPEPATELDRRDLRQNAGVIVPLMSCIWSTGPNLEVRRRYDNRYDDASDRDKNDERLVYYIQRRASPPTLDESLPTYLAWSLGFWFPIPAEQH